MRYRRRFVDGVAVYRCVFSCGLRENGEVPHDHLVVVGSARYSRMVALYTVDLLYVSTQRVYALLAEK